MESQLSPHSKSILEIIIDQIRLAKSKLTSGEMLFPTQEAFYRSILYQRTRERNTFMSQEASQSTIDNVTTLLDQFDPATATKKGIRELRKALGALSKEKYPRKPKKA